MRVLLIESMKGMGNEVAATLREEGHTVASCFDSLESVPCVGVDDPSSCPLEGDGVDVAVLVRDPTLARPSLQEMGAMCVMRHKVPLIEALAGPDSPFAGRATPAGPDLATAVEAAYQRGLAEYAEHVRREVVSLPQLAATGHDTVKVQVRRTPRRVLLVLDLPSDLPHAAVESAVTWATRAARDYDEHVPVIDVAVQRTGVATG